MKQKRNKESIKPIRVDLDMDNDLERKCYEWWSNGFQACPGVVITGRQLFLHAIAMLAEGKKSDNIAKIEGRIEELSTKNMSVFD
jgi:hypothetical protein